MAKKVKPKNNERVTFNAKHGLLFLAVAFLGALAFASIIQGILMQISFGFKYGFFSYLLGFIFMAAAKYVKWQLFGSMRYPKKK